MKHSQTGCGTDWGPEATAFSNRGRRGGGSEGGERPPSYSGLRDSAAPNRCHVWRSPLLGVENLEEGDSVPGWVDRDEVAMSPGLTCRLGLGYRAEMAIALVR